MSAAFSAIMMVVRLVLALVMTGMIEASTTRSPSMPITRHCGSTTDSGSFARPILQLPMGCPMGATALRISSSVNGCCLPGLAIHRPGLLRHDLNGDLPTSALTDDTCGGDFQVLVRLKFEDMAGAGFAQVPPGSDRELRTLEGVQMHSALHYC